MEILNNYIEYRKNKPKYAEWKRKREESFAKKEAYLKQNPVSNEEKQRAVQKANIILNAVDTLDESSQSKAENTEVVTESFSALATIGTLALGMGAGAIFMATKGGKAKMAAFAKKHPKLEKFNLQETLPQILGSLCTLPIIAPVVSWAAKNEILASKIGRYEAVTTKLNSENQFALLDEEQLQELDQKAKNIEIKDDKAKDKVENGFKEAKAAISDLTKENLEVQNYVKSQNERFENEKQNFDKPLTKEEIKAAKEEQYIITRIVETADTASQDYAEDVEFGASILAIGGGILGAVSGFIIKGLSNTIKSVKNKNAAEVVQNAAQKASKANKHSGLFPLITTLIGTVAAGIITTKLTKQASRVARFKVIQDFKENPEKLIYVEDDKSKDVEVKNPAKEEKKENLFEFLVRLFKENKEYNDYMKVNGKKEKQLNLARNEIKLTENQRKQAKQLQENIFKTFNKIDDKSQTYSESTEALGEIIKEYGNEIMSTGGMLISMLLMYKNKNKPYSVKNMLIALLPMFLTNITGLALNAFVTSEQKKSSRVAHMLAINELEDFRHFANHDAGKKEEPQVKEASKDKTPEQKEDIKTQDPKDTRTDTQEVKETQDEKETKETQENTPKEPAEEQSETESKKAAPTPLKQNSILQNMNLDKVFAKFI